MIAACRRRGRSALGRLLQARASALPRRPRPRSPPVPSAKCGMVTSHPVSATARRRPIRRRRGPLAGQSRTLSGGGFFFEGACHTFDFLDFLFGPIVDVRAFAGNQGGAYRPEDIVTATYQVCFGRASEAVPGATPRTSTRNTTRSWATRGRIRFFDVAAGADPRSSTARQSRRFRSPTRTTSINR